MSRRLLWPTVPNLDNWLPGKLSSSPLKQFAYHSSTWPAMGLIEQTEKEECDYDFMLGLEFFKNTNSISEPEA